MIDVDYYKFEDGTNPIDPYLDELDPKMRAKQGSNIERVLYFFFTGNKAILTNGFTKKQQKTPPGQIRLAKDRRTDYERRHKK